MHKNSVQLLFVLVIIIIT